MKSRHLGVVSKPDPIPSTACSSYMDGTAKGLIRYKFCDKGKLDPPS